MTFDNMVLQLVHELNGYGIILYVLITTFAAVLLSFCVGLERQIRGKTGSLKIHLLLAAGCSLLMSLSLWGIRVADGTIDLVNGVLDNAPKTSYDTSRVAASIVAGMGFIGAGAIIKDKFTVKGLSTAASLWVAAAIGLACGSGFLLESVVFTVVVLLCLLLISRVNRHLAKKASFVLVKAKRGTPIVKLIEQIANENDISYKNIEIVSIDEEFIVAKVLFPYHYSKLEVEYFKTQVVTLDGVSVEEQ